MRRACGDTKSLRPQNSHDAGPSAPAPGPAAGDGEARSHGGGVGGPNSGGGGGGSGAGSNRGGGGGGGATSARFAPGATMVRRRGGGGGGPQGAGRDPRSSSRELIGPSNPRVALHRHRPERAARERNPRGSSRSRNAWLRILSKARAGARSPSHLARRGPARAALRRGTRAALHTHEQQRQDHRRQRGAVSYLSYRTSSSVKTMVRRKGGGGGGAARHGPAPALPARPAPVTREAVRACDLRRPHTELGTGRHA